MQKIENKNYIIHKLGDGELQEYRNISIYQIVGLSNDGRKKSIKCPFHNERTPSFYIYPDNSFHCFGCGKHGEGAIDFLSQFGYSFPEIIKGLNDYI